MFRLPQRYEKEKDDGDDEETYFANDIDQTSEPVIKRSRSSKGNAGPLVEIQASNKQAGTGGTSSKALPKPPEPPVLPDDVEPISPPGATEVLQTVEQNTSLNTSVDFVTTVSEEPSPMSHSTPVTVTRQQLNGNTSLRLSRLGAYDYYYVEGVCSVTTFVM